jgi:hypothetical protein
MSLPACLALTMKATSVPFRRGETVVVQRPKNEISTGPESWQRIVPGLVGKIPRFEPPR